MDEPTQTTAAPGAPGATPPLSTSPSSAPPVDAPKIDDAARELERLRAEVADLRKESASYRVRARDEKTAAEKALEEQGHYKALAEAQKARLAELEQLEPAAKRWAEHEAREAQRISTVRATLSPEQQAALDAAPDLQGKQAVLRALDAMRGNGSVAPPPPRAPAGGAPPAPTASTNWESLADLGADALREARLRDPAGWDAYVRTQSGGARSQSTWRQRFARIAGAKGASNGAH